MAQEKSGSHDDLKAREYRDAKGQVHHHTRTYMEAHRQEGGGKAAPAGSEKSGARSGSGGDGRRAGRAAGAGRARVAGARAATDHEEIRRWAEAHGGKPAAVKRTHRDGDVGIIRIMFPDAPNSEHEELEEISWDEFFKEFEARKLAVLYDPDSLFSKIIGRDTAAKRAKGDHDAHR